MNKGPNKITQTSLLDVILKGLHLSATYDYSSLNKLSQVSKYFNQRLKRSFIWESLVPEDDKPHVGISTKDIAEISSLIHSIGHEIPNAQPIDSQEWQDYLDVPKSIKHALIKLYPIAGPDLLKYVKELCTPYSKEINGMSDWVHALLALYQSANEEPDAFHGLFLNNHNFAKRAYELAKKTTLYFSTQVLAVCSECRFSSLTMNSMQLTTLFEELAGYYEKRNKKERTFDRFSGNYSEVYISRSDIKSFIKKKFYAKTLLWRSVTESTASSEEHLSLNSSAEFVAESPVLDAPLVTSSEEITPPHKRRRR